MSMLKSEKILGAITLFVVAFGLLGTQTRSRLELITKKKEKVTELSARLQTQRELIASAQDWKDRYDKVKDQMPVFEKGKQVDTYWLNIMDFAAEQHGVKIRNRSAKEETIISDVYEFPIEVREWEATLEAFLKFMHAMQSEGAMLNIRELKVSPVPNKQGILKGSFVLYCAYMRGTATSAPTPVAAPQIMDTPVGTSPLIDSALLSVAAPQIVESPSETPPPTKNIANTPADGVTQGPAE